MLAHDVADFVAEHDLKFFWARDLDQARVEHDERVVHAVSASVHDRRLRDIQRWYVGIEHFTYPYQRLVNRGVLLGPDLHRSRGEDGVDVLLAEGADELAKKRIEPGDLLQRG